MASIYALKPRFQALLRPLSRTLVRIGATPNTVTLAALVGSALVGGLLLRSDGPRVLLALPVWLFVRMALNAIDGMMAREHGMASSLGGVLNEVGDVLSDLSLYLPLAARFADPWPVVCFAVGGVVTEFAGVTTRALGASRRYDGPMGKSDRAFVVGAVALVLAFQEGAERAWPDVVFWLAAGLTLVCSVRRLRGGLAELEGG